MNLVHVANYIADAGFGQLGRDIFVHAMPPEVVEGLLLRDRYTGDTIDPYTNLRWGGFQLVVRTTTFGIGKEMADELARILVLDGETLGDMEIKYMRPKHTPVAFPLSEGSFVETMLTFEACWAQLSV